MLTTSVLRKACRVLGWTAIGTWPERLDGVGTDSRAPLEHQLFVALVGERFDGHEFLDAAVRQGARVLLVQRLYAARWGRKHPELLVVGVEDTLYALGELARLARGEDPRPVVAITGSAGKTTTRWALVQALEAAGVTAHTQVGNENNRIGVPRFLLNLPEPVLGPEVVVVECGTSEPGEIARLGAICWPNVSVITAVCAAHTELLIDESGVAHEKGDLARAASPGEGFAVVVPGDERLERAALEGERRLLAPHDLMDAPGWSGAPAHLRANGSKALAVVAALGFELTDAVVRGARLDPPAGRGGVIDVHDWRVMDDSYNANQASMIAALDTAAAAAGLDGLPLVACLGEMRELGDQAEEAHRQVLQHAIDVGAQKIVFTGPYAALAAAQAEGHEAVEVTVADDASDLLSRIDDLPRPAFVLVKGSRGARMERWIEAMRERG